MPQPTVVHLTATYLPWTTGGKEVYTHSLGRELRKLGWINHVVIHQNEKNPEPLGKHDLEGMQVHVLPPLTDKERIDYYACRTRTNPGYAELLHELKPDIVHFQDYSQAANLLHLDQSKAAGARTVMTYHSPGQSCLQREMLRNGTIPCDGEIKLGRCTECRLAVQGIPVWLRWPLAQMTLPEIGTSRLSRAISARKMTTAFAQSFKELVQRLDRIHVLSQWVNDVLALNHVPAEKISFIRSGLPLPPQERQAKPARKAGEPLKLLMAGRCEQVKGQVVLIDAVKQLPASMKVEVSFLGPYWDNSEYGRHCLQKIAGDSRFAPPRLVSRQDMPNVLSQGDALVIPSVWLENAPLVVLEALAYGLPVLGSRLGGIPEMVSDGVTGLLFTAGSSAELSQCITRLVQEEGLLETFQKNITKPRQMHDVALDTVRMYEEVLR